MDLHQRMKMKKIVLWLPKLGKEKGINLPNPKLKARSMICPR